MAHLLKFDTQKIDIYPLGGVTKYNALLNSSMLKEFLILIAGPGFQILFFLLIHTLYINGFVFENTYNIVKIIHHSLLLFNILPIVPLDGSKLLNLILQISFSYKKANIITIVISIITVLCLILFKFSLFFILLALLLVKSIVLEIKEHGFKINKFLLERLIYKLNLKKGKTIKSIYDVKRGKKHCVIKKNKIYDERIILQELFDLKR